MDARRRTCVFCQQAGVTAPPPDPASTPTIQVVPPRPRVSRSHVWAARVVSVLIILGTWTLVSQAFEQHGFLSAAAVRAQARPGPTFTECDAVMNDKGSGPTAYQKAGYWPGVEGTLVRWTGEVRELSADGSRLTLTCNPANFSYPDTYVTLDGTQAADLYQLTSGRKVTVEGILRTHSVEGYTLDDGRVADFAAH